MLAGWSGARRRLTVIEVSVGVGELGSAAVGEQEDHAAVSTSAVSASEWVIEEAMVEERAPGSGFWRAESAKECKACRKHPPVSGGRP